MTESAPYAERTGRRVNLLGVAGALFWVGIVGLVLWQVAWPQSAGEAAVAAGAADQPRQVTARGDLAADEKSTIELFRTAAPSVVYITTHAPMFDPWRRFVTEVPRGTGSGFIWDESGLVVTNFHVIRGASSAQVVLHDQSTYRAELVGVSADHELAVLRISAPRDRLRPLPIGTSHNLQVGQKILAIGNPFGLDHTLTTGVISALGRRIQSTTRRPIDDVIQIDAAINPGNSGGPLLDSAGRLIGVNTAIASPTGAYAGVGFAVPVDTVNRIVPVLIARGRYSPPTIGIRLSDPASQAVVSRMGVSGVLILDVVKGSGAAEAALRGTRRAADGSIIPGDIIQKVAELAVASANDLFRALEKHKAGDVVTLSILREGRTEQVEVRLQ